MLNILTVPLAQIIHVKFVQPALLQLENVAL